MWLPSPPKQAITFIAVMTWTHTQLQGGEEPRSDVLLLLACHSRCLFSWNNEGRVQLCMISIHSKDHVYGFCFLASGIDVCRLFQHSIEEADLSGELSVDAEWMAYMGGFHHLRILRATDCRSLTNNALWHLVGVISLLCFTTTMHRNKRGLYLIQAILQSGIPGIGWSKHICRNT